MNHTFKKWLGIILVMLAITALLLFSGITIPLDFLDHRLENLAGNLLDREITIHGPVRLKTSLQPSLELGGLTIGNPVDWPEDSSNLLTVEHARARVSLTDLARGDIRINNLEFSGVDLQLVTRPDNSTNYRFPAINSKADKKKTASVHELTGLDRISLRDIRISYLDRLSSRNYSLEIEEAHGTGMPEEPLHLDLKGKLSGQDCRLSITGGSLHDLVQGGDAWQLADGTLSLNHISLDLSASINRSRDGLNAYLALSLKGHSLEEIGTILDIPLPEIGDFTLDGQVAFLPGEFQFSNIRFKALDSSLAADLLLALEGNRPTLEGNIEVDRLSPQLPAAFQNTSGPEAVEMEEEGKFAGRLEWEALQRLNTDLHIKVQQFDAGGVSVKSLHGQISLIDGDLIMPVSLILSGIPVHARLDVLSSTTIPTLNVELKSEKGDLDPLLAGISGKDTLHGHIGSLFLDGGCKGATITELMKNLSLDLHLNKLNIRDNTMKIVDIDTLSLQRRPGELISLTSKGELFNRPLHVKAEIGKDKNTRNSDTTAMHIRITACDSDFAIDTVPPADTTGIYGMRFSATGKKLCGFLEPVEQYMGGSVSFSVVGNSSLHPGKFNLNLPIIHFGDLIFDGKAELTTDKDGNPQIKTALHSDAVNLTPLLSPADGADTSGKERSSEESADDREELDQKIALLKKALKKEIIWNKNLFETDVQLSIRVDEVESGRVQVNDLDFLVKVKNGKLTPSPFRARIGNNLFSGNGAIDFDTKLPTVHLQLGTDNLDLPDLLKEMQVDNAPQITAEHINFDLTTSGNNLTEMIANASQKLSFNNANWTISRKGAAPLIIDLKRADYTAEPKQPTKIHLLGNIDNQKFSANITGDGLLAKGTNEPVFLEIDTKLGDTRLTIQGKIDSSTRDKEPDMQLSATIDGKQLDQLNELLAINLPPLGPYRLAGTIRSEAGLLKGIKDFAVQVGDSILSGELLIDFPEDEETTEGKVAFRTRLTADSIQLDDFQLGDWSAMGNQSKTETDSEPDDKTREKSQYRDLLSAEFSKTADFFLDVQVKEVLSGDDELGNGILEARLENGRYSLDKLQLNIPGGTVVITGALQPESDSVSSNLMMNIEHFDYGILARRFKPDAGLKGELNLRLDLHSRAGGPAELKEHMNGHFRFGVKPEDYQAGVLDLWAVNIITAALPALLKGSKSEVNCMAGHFILEDGIMRPKVFLLDTSKMRVEGKGEVNFKTNTIDFHLRPTPKSAHFFSLATPISVSGTVTDYHIGVTAGGILKTVFRMATSVVTVPFQWLFTDNMEPDGRQACLAAMDWVKEAETE